MTIKQLYDNIKSYPNDNMDFCIENVFVWRGIFIKRLRVKYQQEMLANNIIWNNLKN